MGSCLLATKAGAKERERERDGESQADDEGDVKRQPLPSLSSWSSSKKGLARTQWLMHEQNKDEAEVADRSAPSSRSKRSLIVIVVVLRPFSRPNLRSPIVLVCAPNGRVSRWPPSSSSSRDDVSRRMSSVWPAS